MFSLSFLICNFAITFVLFVVYVLIRTFKRHLSVKFKYGLGLILLMALFVPFIPLQQTNIDYFDNYLAINEEQSNSDIENSIKVSPNNLDLLTDNQETILKTNWKYLDKILIFIWIIGMFYISCQTLYTNYKIFLIKKNSVSNNNFQIDALLQSCLIEMKIKKKIPIKMTSKLNSPGLVGFCDPCILFPKNSLDAVSLKNLRFVILHELQHYRNNDVLINYIICMGNIIYWFNPCVRWMLKQIRQLQEISCDISVLDKLDPSTYFDYGNALIDFAELLSKNKFAPLYNIGGSYEQIRRRIFTISQYRRATFKSKLKDVSILILLSIVIFCNIPSTNIFAFKNNVTLNDINYATIDLSSYFGNYNGCFVLYNTQNDTYSLYNTHNCLTRISPDSTYKIYSALAGLENSIITPTNTLQLWSGTQYTNTDWNNNHTLQSAMKDSVNWYFQTLDAKLGSSKLQRFFNDISYGNKNLTGGLSTYWLESSLLISPLEQVQLLGNLWTNTWKFDTENIELVKDSICISEKYGKTLYGKTGTGNINEKYINGWFIGCVESKDNTYIFATNIRGNDNCDGKTSAQITLNILSNLDIF